jgi:two-component system response regulator YesN
MLWPGERHKAEFDELLAGHINPAQARMSQLGSSLADWAFQRRLHPDAFKELTNEWRREWLKDDRTWPEFSQISKAVMRADTAQELVAVLIHEMDAVWDHERKPRREIDDAMRYIKSNLGKSLTLSIVAEQVGLSAHYLCRLFPEEKGVSFQEYIKQQRMEMAARLLRSTSLRIYEIACQVGVPSYRYFSSVFREYAGLSPTEYRRQGPLQH